MARARKAAPKKRAAPSKSKGKGKAKAKSPSPTPQQSPPPATQQQHEQGPSNASPSLHDKARDDQHTMTQIPEGTADSSSISQQPDGFAKRRGILSPSFDPLRVRIEDLPDLLYPDDPEGPDNVEGAAPLSPEIPIYIERPLAPERGAGPSAGLAQSATTGPDQGPATQPALPQIHALEPMDPLKLVDQLPTPCLLTEPSSYNSYQSQNGSDSRARQAYSTMPAEESYLKKAVFSLRSMQDEHGMYDTVIKSLSDTVENAQGHLEDLRRRIRQEAARRERIENYLEGWRNIGEEWDNRDIYGGGDKRRIKYVEGRGPVELESDEESVDEYSVPPIPSGAIPTASPFERVDQPAKLPRVGSHVRRQIVEAQARLDEEKARVEAERNAAAEHVDVEMAPAENANTQADPAPVPVNRTSRKRAASITEEPANKKRRIDPGAAPNTTPSAAPASQDKQNTRDHSTNANANRAPKPSFASIAEESEEEADKIDDASVVEMLSHHVVNGSSVDNSVDDAAAVLPESIISVLPHEIEPPVLTQTAAKQNEVPEPGPSKEPAAFNAGQNPDDADSEGDSDEDSNEDSDTDEDEDEDSASGSDSDKAMDSDASEEHDDEDVENTQMTKTTNKEKRTRTRAEATARRAKKTGSGSGKGKRRARSPTPTPEPDYNSECDSSSSELPTSPRHVTLPGGRVIQEPMTRLGRRAWTYLKPQPPHPKRTRADIRAEQEAEVRRVQGWMERRMLLQLSDRQMRMELGTEPLVYFD